MAFSFLDVASDGKIVLFHEEIQMDKKENFLHSDNWNISSLLHLVFVLNKY